MNEVSPTVPVAERKSGGMSVQKLLALFITSLLTAVVTNAVHDKRTVHLSTDWERRWFGTLSVETPYPVQPVADTFLTSFRDSREGWRIYGTDERAFPRCLVSWGQHSPAQSTSLDDEVSAHIKIFAQSVGEEKEPRFEVEKLFIEGLDARRFHFRHNAPFQYSYQELDGFAASRGRQVWVVEVISHDSKSSQDVVRIIGSAEITPAK